MNPRSHVVQEFHFRFSKISVNYNLCKIIFQFLERIETDEFSLEWVIDEMSHFHSERENLFFRQIREKKDIFRTAGILIKKYYESTFRLLWGG